MQAWAKTAAVASAVAVIGGVGWRYFNPGPESNPIRAESNTSVTVLPFSTLTRMDDLPVGWIHDQFWMVRPMQMQFAEKDGRPAARCETNSSGSILRRTTDIEVGDYPVLAWEWLIEFPISSNYDEATEQGDDHPARILLQLEDRQGGAYGFEIVWSNAKYKPGDYFTIGDTVHYVANGLDENTKVWQQQEVNLMQIYRDITGRDDFPLLKSIGIFCDSDNTRTRSIAYFSEVEMRAR